MQVRRAKRNAPIQITFGEQTEAEKRQAIQDLKVSSKLGRKLTRRLYPSSFKILRNLTVKVEGGFSKAYSKILNKKGIAADGYYFLAFATEVDVMYTPSIMRNEIVKAMIEFEKLIDQKSEHYNLTGEPRINRLEILFNWM